jgi:hypothetical protein
MEQRSLYAPKIAGWIAPDQQLGSWAVAVKLTINGLTGKVETGVDNYRVADPQSVIG